jgi:hypothetical protein
MPLDELLRRVHADPEAAPADWNALRREIQEEHARASSEAERVALVAVFHALMDRVERSVIAPQEQGLFRETRLQSYRLLLIREAQIGENVCAETLYAVTRREIEAGRMSAEDELCRRAAREVAAPHLTRAELMAIEAQKRAEASLLPQTQPASRWRRALKWLRRG